MHEEIYLFSGHTFKTKWLESVYQIVSCGLPGARLIEDTESINQIEIGSRAELQFKVLHIPFKLQLALEYEECMSISDRRQL